MRSLLPLAFGFTLGVAVTGAPALAGITSPVEVAFRLALGAQEDALVIRDLARQVREPWVRDQLLEATGRLDNRLHDLVEITQPRARPPAPPPRPPPAPVIVVTTDAEWAAILGAIDQEAFSDQKLAILRSAAGGRAVTTDQVIRLLEEFAFGDDKVEAAAFLYPGVVDKDQWFRVYGALTFSSDKDALRKRTGG